MWMVVGGGGGGEGWGEEGGGAWWAGEGPASGVEGEEGESVAIGRAMCAGGRDEKNIKWVRGLFLRRRYGGWAYPNDDGGSVFSDGEADN